MNRKQGVLKPPECKQTEHVLHRQKYLQSICMLCEKPFYDCIHIT